MSETTKNPHHTEEDFLEVDKPVPGQNFVCLSFVSPEKTITTLKKVNVLLRNSMK
jgi:hypothetical protein